MHIWWNALRDLHACRLNSKDTGKNWPISSLADISLLFPFSLSCSSAKTILYPLSSRLRYYSSVSSSTSTLIIFPAMVLTSVVLIICSCRIRLRTVRYSVSFTIFDSWKRLNSSLVKQVDCFWMLNVSGVLSASSSVACLSVADALLPLKSALSLLAWEFLFTVSLISLEEKVQFLGLAFAM